MCRWEAGLANHLLYDDDGSIKVEVVKAPFIQVNPPPPVPPRTPHFVAGLYEWDGGLVYQLFTQSPRGEFRKSDNMPDLFLDHSELGDKRWSNSLLMGDYKRFRSFLTGFD